METEEARQDLIREAHRLESRIRAEQIRWECKSPGAWYAWRLAQAWEHAAARTERRIATAAKAARARLVA